MEIEGKKFFLFSKMNKEKQKIAKKDFPSFPRKFKKLKIPNPEFPMCKDCVVRKRICKYPIFGKF